MCLVHSTYTVKIKNVVKIKINYYFIISRSMSSNYLDDTWKLCECVLPPTFHKIFGGGGEAEDREKELILIQPYYYIGLLLSLLILNIPHGIILSYSLIPIFNIISFWAFKRLNGLLLLWT